MVPWSWYHHYYNFRFAGVICRQLNFSDSILAVSWAVFGPGTGPQWYDIRDIQCLGDESSLQNCTYYDQPQLRTGDHDYDLSVICKPNNAQANGELLTYFWAVITVSAKSYHKQSNHLLTQA